MNNYDFTQLNDKEFESLCCDLMSAKTWKFIQRFKPGKDSWIDWKFYWNKEEAIIIQAKHYIKSGIQHLISTLRDKEFYKAKQLSPQRYILMTSLPLSPKNKADIMNVMPWIIKKDDDILWKDEINALLSEYKKVEEKYYKLWIASSNILKRFLNNRIFEGSLSELQKIQENTIIYHPTQSHQEATEKIKENRVLIISWEPWIWKSTLAENLWLQYLKDNPDSEFYIINNDITEAWDVYEKERKQFFYYDDFLWSNYFEAIENNKDSQIVRFIDRISQDKNKVFILTSRTNILKQGILCSDKFMINKIDKNEFLLEIWKFRNIDKAHILYNHMWHSHLSKDYIEELYKDKRYMQIILHKNFNPRIISFITDNDRLINTSSEEYWKFVKDKLDNPSDIWEHTFSRQSDEFIRNLVSLIVFNWWNCEENLLKNAFRKIIEIEKVPNFTNTSKRFDDIVKLSIKYYINRNVYKNSKKIYYTLFNPSISDFIINKYNKDQEKLINIYQALESHVALCHLNNLVLSGKITEYYKNNILEELFSNIDTFIENYDFTIYIIAQFFEDENKKGRIKEILTHILNNPKEINVIDELLDLCEVYNDLVTEKVFSNFTSFFHYTLSRDDEINSKNRIYKIRNKDDEKFYNNLVTDSGDYLKQELKVFIDELDVTKAIEKEYDYEGQTSLNTNRDILIDEIKEYGKDFLADNKRNDLINDDKLEEIIFSLEQHLEEKITKSEEEMKYSDYDDEYRWKTTERDDNIEEIEELFRRE